MERCQEALHFRVLVPVHNTDHLISSHRIGRVCHLILKKQKLKTKKRLKHCLSLPIWLLKNSKSLLWLMISWKLFRNTYTLCPFARSSSRLASCRINQRCGEGPSFPRAVSLLNVAVSHRLSSWAGTGSTCSPEETTVWSWSGRCLTSSSSSPIQAATPGSGPWHCLRTRGNTGIVVYTGGMKTWRGNVCKWADGWTGLWGSPVQSKKLMNIEVSKILFKKHDFVWWHCQSWTKAEFSRNR